MTNKRSVLLFEFQRRDPDFILEMKAWEVPVSDHYPHGISYRFWFGRPGETLLLYDVHHGKPYHVHIGGLELEYEFVDLDTLIRDFLEHSEACR